MRKPSTFTVAARYPRSLCARRGGASMHGARRQHGVVAVLAVIWLSIAIAALGAIDIGNVFFVRRQLQRAADLAAVAGVQLVSSAGGCSAATAAATQSAATNGLPASGTVTVSCGRWDTATSTTLTTPPADGTGSPINAVKVTVGQSVPYFFLGPARNVQASATAKATNIGAFTIGTSLISVGSNGCTASSSTLNNVLGGLLGMNLQLDAVSYCGLATARIKMRDLVVAANAGTVDGLLALPVTVSSLANLMVSALQQTSVVNANLSSTIGALQTVGSANVPGGFNIGDSSSASGLLSLGLANTQAALDATISPLDALIVSAEIARKGQPPINIAAGLNLPGLSTTLNLQIIQPPVLAIGEAGTPAGDSTAWVTTARSAQVRAYLKLNLGTASLPIGFLGALLPINVSLPIYLEVAPGRAGLSSTQCASTSQASQSVVGVQTGLANLCVGDWPNDLSATQAFSCTNPATLVNVSQVTVTGVASVSAVNPQTGSLTFDGVVDNEYQSTNSNNVGGVISNALSGLGAQLAKPNALTVQLSGLSLPPGSIASPIVTLLGNVLAPALAGLDTLLVPVLQLLGAQIGVSTIHDLSLTCGVSQLVN
ncbi:TadG family pilus assembly protein [Paraburkholderia sp. GAS348]|uniref:TadG family pilus assembly protein n=1 Tax=Paraburkholderia sp. GAS348 TaxID=3035132 RepID=UPI003D1A4BA5